MLLGQKMFPTNRSLLRNISSTQSTLIRDPGFIGLINVERYIQSNVHSLEELEHIIVKVKIYTFIGL